MMLRYHPRGEQIDSVASAHAEEEKTHEVEELKVEMEQTEMFAPIPEKRKPGRPRKNA